MIKNVLYSVILLIAVFFSLTLDSYDKKAKKHPQYFRQSS